MDLFKENLSDQKDVYDEVMLCDIDSKASSRLLPNSCSKKFSKREFIEGLCNYTPKKKYVEFPGFSLTPMSMVKKLQDLSPEMTKSTKKIGHTPLKTLTCFNQFSTEKKPKYQSPFLNNVFQHSIEKEIASGKKIELKKRSEELQKKSKTECTLFYDKYEGVQAQKFKVEEYQKIKLVQRANTVYKQAPNNFMNGCNCRNSKCLKLYCECLRKGKFCVDCNCVNCQNTEDSQLRKEKVKNIQKKDPNAFKPIIYENQIANKKMHVKGCNCKKSSCMKNYCECHQHKVKCNSQCKCIGCKNIEDFLDQKSKEQIDPNKSSKINQLV